MLGYTAHRLCARKIQGSLAVVTRSRMTLYTQEKNTVEAALYIVMTREEKYVLTRTEENKPNRTVISIRFFEKPWLHPTHPRVRVDSVRHAAGFPQDHKTTPAEVLIKAPCIIKTIIIYS